MGQNFCSPFTLELEAELESLGKIADFLEEKGKELKIPPETLFALNLAVDEAVTNVITHAYPPHAKGTVGVTITRSKDKVQVTVFDQGSFFDLKDALPPDISSPLKTRRIGGLGVFFIHKMMDKITQSRKKGVNKLVMTKIL